MKKTLAIVLALVMVLAMIPAMSAHTTSYTAEKTHVELDLEVWNGNDTKKLGDATASTTVTAEYDFESATDAPEVDTGRWSEKKKMAVVTVKGFDFKNVDDVKSVKIDNKDLSVDELAPYEKLMGAREGGIVNFPIELTKAGYTDTFMVTVVSETTDTDGKKLTLTENAKISVKLENTASYKGEETAKVTNIASTNKLGKASVYIVGDKLYVDATAWKTEGEDANAVEFKVTFADENGAAFTAITYAKDPVVWNGSKYEVNNKHITVSKKNDNGKYVDAGDEIKLADSAATYIVDNSSENQKIKFVLETKAADYETKAYTIKMRYGIYEEDPKGIYFAETTKTIAMGETYTPVVMGVKTGKPVAATLVPGAGTDREVIDIVNDGASVIGTREGIAYITAEYTPFGYTGKYESSSMKIVVTLPGESIPALDPSAETYYVTCRALNVRAGAGTSYKKVDLIHRGDAVKVVETKNGWAKLDDGTWVCAKYIAK